MSIISWQANLSSGLDAAAFLGSLLTGTETSASGSSGGFVGLPDEGADELVGSLLSGYGSSLGPDATAGTPALSAGAFFTDPQTGSAGALSLSDLLDVPAGSSAPEAASVQIAACRGMPGIAAGTGYGSDADGSSVPTPPVDPGPPASGVLFGGDLSPASPTPPDLPSIHFAGFVGGALSPPSASWAFFG
jgi:hypothetical protein